MIETLHRGNLKIVQSDSSFKFGIDAVLLAHFARAGKTDCVVDLCSGNAVIPLLMHAEQKGGHFTALELQGEAAALAEESVRLNQLEDKITVINDDLRRVSSLFEPQSVRVVTCNPPYMPVGEGTVNPLSARSAARHELFCTLDEVVQAASYLLKPRGSFFMIHRPQRLQEIFNSFLDHKLSVKRLQLVQPGRTRPPSMVLIQGVKCGGTGLVALPTLNVYEDDGSCTREVDLIYGRGF